MSKQSKHEFVFLGPNGDKIICHSFAEVSNRPELRSIFLDMAAKNMGATWEEFTHHSVDAVVLVRAHAMLDGHDDVAVVFLEDVFNSLEAYYNKHNPFESDELQDLTDVKMELARIGVKYHPGLTTEMTKRIVQVMPNTLRLGVDEVIFGYMKLDFFSKNMEDGHIEERTEFYKGLRSSCWSEFRAHVAEASKKTITAVQLAMARKERHEFKRLTAEGFDVKQACDTAITNVRQRGGPEAFKRWLKSTFGIDTLTR